ncbi:MAG TPA: ISKra4 family transposase, partial [Methylocystis sp.]|nr:ISKra4 family transposase [Methylocystis sp.]
LRPFVRGAKVSPLGCSRPLQRAIVDFAADQPFAQARGKLEEHYGVKLGESTIQRITFGHAEAMFEAERAGVDFPQEPGPSKPIIVETDGGMVPIVEPSRDAQDKRKGKKLSWREAKLSLAHAQGSRTPVYAGSIEGGVEAAGRQLLSCAVRAGFGMGSQVHAVGDGAPWIVGQVEEQFGDQGRYLIDFYHVCEYLSAAALAIASDAAGREAWIEAQKEALKAGRLDATLQALAGHCEAPEIDDEQAPVRRCRRYLSSRRAQLDYRGALANGLPIGSGEIESAHRYVAQQRLKRPGAWWRVEHADHMLALRILRINGDWNAYWKNLRRAPPVANDNARQKSKTRAA